MEVPRESPGIGAWPARLGRLGRQHPYERDRARGVLLRNSRDAATAGEAGSAMSSSDHSKVATATTVQPTADTPLEGVRVIEFGQLLAGPYVGTLLGDFGADVVKVEAPPKRRRDARLGPPAPQRPLAVVVDPGAQQALRHAEPARAERARRSRGASPSGADVVIENFRPGTMERWGLGPGDLHARQPARSIYARVSGYGQTGRYRDRPGLASAGEAIGGLRYINGYPGQAPPRSGISPRRHASRAVRLSGHPAGALRPRRPRRGAARSSTHRSPTRASR